jgi:hypothetical protein
MENVTVLETGLVAHQLAGLYLAPRQDDKALALWPLLSRSAAGPPSRSVEYLLLSEALEDGLAGLSAPEADGAAEVENRAPLPLLILAGEPLGSPSSGVVARSSVLAAPRGASTVPTEARPGNSHDPLSTGRLHELRPLAGQLGFVATLGDSVLGLELLGDAHIFARALPVLVTVYWRRALTSAFRCGPGRVSCFDAPEPFLEALSHARTLAREDAHGARRLRLDGEGVVGEALLAGHALAHLTARAATRSAATR